MKKYGFGGFVFDENIILMKYINVNDGNMYEKMLNVDVIFGGCCCSWYNARQRKKWWYTYLSIHVCSDFKCRIFFIRL